MTLDHLKHAQRARLVFLDHCLTWRGVANRRDLEERFGISTAQAAVDFRVYLDLTATPPVYDPTRKTYVATPDHAPLAPADALQAFDLLSDDVGTASLPRPTRQADPAIIARLYQTMRAQKALRLCYTSITSGESPDQWIAPVRFTSDGEAVHLRAYSYKHQTYRNYLPIRIAPDSPFEQREIAPPLPRDTDWHTKALIKLRPASHLTDAQAQVVRREFGFRGTYLLVETRKALEFFLDHRWGLDRPDARLERAGTEYVSIPQTDTD
ncbi:hypothetical protein SAMN05444279_1142 [Ruegeria intermedia]|uniref:WYL domain-containing protein n=2 Tax=Ruegeria intermedia TaxID=996115 RepID=A0A1M4Y4Z9_9RHOB|nr:hypothetical protein SAMN05444279_1142 [Ruegeria intermedia]